MIPAKPFYLVRHGETEANAARITAGGHLDSPLTDFGRQQARMLGAVVDGLDIRPTKVIHSPMVRARDTASYINSKLELLMHEIDDLREHIVGEWEGRPWEEIMPHIRANVRPPGGENKDDYGARVQRTLTAILEEHDDPVMIVAHSGTFYSILHLYGRPYDGGINNCHLHYFEPYHSHSAFPWRIWQFDIHTESLKKCSAPFCATADLAKTG